MAGCAQLCAGQRSRYEVAVHTIDQLLQNDEVEGVLLVDASNAFNSLNRAAMLRNIQILCPSFATSVINLYRGEAELFVGGETLLSKEGTTQGDSLAMAINALSTLPLIDSVKQRGLTQTWFADDACGGSRLETIHSWWLQLVSEGPKYGYFVNSPKTWLLVKDQHPLSPSPLLVGRF